MSMECVFVVKRQFNDSIGLRNSGRSSPTAKGCTRSLGLREVEITKIPFIISSYRINGDAAYEDNDPGAQWRVFGNGGLDFAFG